MKLIFRMIAFSAALVMASACNNEAKASYTLTITNPFGTSTSPDPANMAQGGQINITGTFTEGFWDYSIDAVYLIVFAPNNKQYFNGDAAHCDSNADTFSQLFMIPSNAPLGNWFVNAQGTCQGINASGASNTKYFAVI